MPSETIDPNRLAAALEKATAALLAARNTEGHWAGELSSSALSTATAVTAFAVASNNTPAPDTRKSEIPNLKSQIASGLQWLATHQNADGGWGDTTKSLSNISTTTLCWAAFGAADADKTFPACVQSAEHWLAQRIGVDRSAFRTPHSALASAIIARYGKDRTFSVPILTMCALAGRLGTGREAWRQVIALPFELAAFPHQFFAALRLPVVSYALPALIAIGQAHHVHAPSRNPVVRWLRSATRAKTLRVLAGIQPGNGGFLEATPLTSFVTMSLAGSGQAGHAVTQRGLEFLSKSQRADGSWPIDTNLATWCTTLALEALPDSQLSTLNPPPAAWLLRQQYRIEHPYTHAAPGGWAWTDLPGGVPDADDTSGALLALSKMGNAESGVRKDEIARAAELGIRWLLDLQNRDGGIPTFCRGWGALPFDQSSADITAHAMRAWMEWQARMPVRWRRRIHHAQLQALGFLVRNQRPDGSFVPLWFGNESAANEENKTYGTARVTQALAAWDRHERILSAGGNRFRLTTLAAAVRWLTRAQNPDGSWGGDAGMAPSVEETALSVQALAATFPSQALFARELAREDVAGALERGARWLIERVESDAWREPSPIGFYFAKLWYFERLYPLLFTVAALEAVARAGQIDD